MSALGRPCLAATAACTEAPAYAWKRMTRDMLRVSSRFELCTEPLSDRAYKTAATQDQRCATCTKQQAKDTSQKQMTASKQALLQAATRSSMLSENCT